jgi:hypothetical protein
MLVKYTHKKMMLQSLVAILSISMSKFVQDEWPNEAAFESIANRADVRVFAALQQHCRSADELRRRCMSDAYFGDARLRVLLWSLTRHRYAARAMLDVLQDMIASREDGQMFEDGKEMWAATLCERALLQTTTTDIRASIVDELLTLYSSPSSSSTSKVATRPTALLPLLSLFRLLPTLAEAALPAVRRVLNSVTIEQFAASTATSSSSTPNVEVLAIAIARLVDVIAPIIPQLIATLIDTCKCQSLCDTSSQVLRYIITAARKTNNL